MTQDDPNKHIDRDHVDEILTEWRSEKPQVDVAAQGVVGRVLRLSRYFERDLADTFRTFGIRGGEFDVLATLRRCGGTRGLPASELADRCMLSSAAMTNRLDGLEAANLVRRATDESDRRVIRIVLTPAGRRLIDDAFPAHAANQSHMVEALSEEEQDLLAVLLRRLLVGYESAEASISSRALAGKDNTRGSRRRPARRPRPLAREAGVEISSPST